MEFSNCFIKADGKQQGLFTAAPADAVRHIVRLDNDKFPGAMTIEAMWLVAPCVSAGMQQCASDTMWVFLGSDVNDHENLGAEIELWIENDKFTITETCVVYIPAGVAHGNIRVKSLDRPVLSYYLRTGNPECKPARAAARAGMYKNNIVYKYAPPNGELPGAPEGFLQLLLYLDTVKLAGAPYMETVWFKTENDTGPAPHVHEFPEFIAFMGTDPDNPEELGAEIQFYMGDNKEYESTTKSTIVYVPANVLHGPIIVPKMTRPVIHFSGNTGAQYIRDDKAEGGNLYKVD